MTNCFFCFTGVEAEKDNDGRINPDCALSLCRILGLDNRLDSEFETNFQNCDFCSVCLEKIDQSQCTLQQIDQLQKEIEASRQEFIGHLRKLYLDNLISKLRKGSTEDNHFRGKIVEALQIVIKIEACDVSQLETQIVDSVGGDSFEQFELVQVESGGDENSQHDHEIAFHLVPVQPAITEIIKKPESTATDNFLENSPPPPSLNDDVNVVVLEDEIPIVTKQVSVRLNRLSPTFIESTTKKKLSRSFKRSLKWGKRGERLKCLFPNCLVTFHNVSARNTHMKIYHRVVNRRKGKSENKKKNFVNKDSDPDPGISENSVNDDNESKVKSTLLSCSFEDCLATFSNEAKRVLHVKRNHEGKFNPTSVKPSKFKCEYENCPQVYRDYFALEAHVKKKHLKLANPYECKYCKLGIRTRDLLYEHIKASHPNYDAKDWSCKLCMERFQSRNLLQDHMNSSHPNSQVNIPCWTCFICSIIFRTRDERTEHIKKQHPGMRNRKPPSSHEEGDDVNSSAQTISQESDAADNLCATCGKSFSTKKQFAEHSKYHGERKFQCGLCPKGFVRPADLRRHKCSYNIGQNDVCDCKKSSEDPETSLCQHSKTCESDSDRRLFQCDQCGVVYKNKKTLDIHIKEHNGIVEKPYQCDLCDYRVRFPGILKYHRKKHFQIQEYVCEFCPSKFKHKNSLNLHRDVRHFGIRGKNCLEENCTYVGMDKQSLEVHVRMKHTKERPFCCLVCSQGFMKKSHLKRHELTHFRNTDDSSGKKRRISRPAILEKRTKLTEQNKGEGEEQETTTVTTTTIDGISQSTDSIQFVDPASIVEFYEVVI